MSKIKTREKAKGKDIKVLDKSAVVGQRMKNAFIRSKRNGLALMDDRQATPSEYAEDKVQFAADDFVHDTANVAVSGTKTTVRQGQKLFQRQREKKSAENRRKNTVPTEQPQAPSLEPQTGTVPEGQQHHQQPSGTTPEGRLPRQRTNTAPEGRLPRQRTNKAPEGQSPRQHSGTAPEGRLPRQRTSVPPERQSPHQRTTTAPDRRLPRQRTDTAPEQPRPKPFQDVIDRRRSRVRAETDFPADTADTVVERGRAFVKKRFEKWAERRQQEKKRAVQSGRPAQPQGKAPDVAGASRQMEAVNVTPPIETSKRPVQSASQTVRSTGRAAEWTGRNTVKSAQRTIKATIKTAEHTAKAAQKTAQATARAARVTVQAARATTKTAATATAAKASAKAVSATVKTIIASVKALVAAIAAGGWIAILAIVVICLIGLIAGSCFGIFFSGEDSGTGQSMPAVVREINQDYEAKLDEIKTANTHNALEMPGSRAVWPDVLAVYAVKTTTDPDNPQEVATMDDNKKALLKEIFWAMNEVSSRTDTSSTTTTQTIETDDGAGNIVETTETVTTTTLYITVTHKSADEMADIYNFTADQRAQLAELLKEENRGAAPSTASAWATGRSLSWPFHRSVTWVVSPIGPGTALTAGWSGAPAL